MQNAVAFLFTVYAVALVVVYAAWTRANQPGRKPRHARRRGTCPHTDSPDPGPCSLCGILGG